MPSEYLIKRTDGDWFNVHRDDYERALVPKSLPWRVVNGGSFEYSIEVSGCEISFSYEDPGILVAFEDEVFSVEEELQLVREILENLTQLKGEAGEVIRL